MRTAVNMHEPWSDRASRLAIVDYWWEQQKAICCLCDDAELLMDTYHRKSTNNPFEATIEHLIPKRDNGPDTAANTRLAHKMCNHALGGLWSKNQDRERRGLEPLSIEWALTNIRKRYAGTIALRLALVRGLSLEQAAASVIEAEIVKPTTLAVELSHRRVPVQTYSPKVRASLAEKGMPKPRGATLPGYVEPIDTGPPAKRSPRVRDLLERQHEKVRRPVCVACGSPEITRDASLKWDRIAGWIIAEHRDGYDCRACDDSTTVRFEFVNPVGA